MHGQDYRKNKQKCEYLMKWLSSSLSNDDKSKADTVPSNQLPIVDRYFQMRKATSDACRFYLGPVPAIPGVLFAYCRGLEYKKSPQSFETITHHYCSMPETTDFPSN